MDKSKNKRALWVVSAVGSILGAGLICAGGVALAASTPAGGTVSRTAVLSFDPFRPSRSDSTATDTGFVGPVRPTASTDDGTAAASNLRPPIRDPFRPPTRSPYVPRPASD